MVYHGGGDFNESTPACGSRIATALAALAAEQQQNSARPEDRVLAAMGPMNPAVAVAWNQTAYEIAFAEDQFFTFKRRSRTGDDARRDP